MYSDEKSKNDNLMREFLSVLEMLKDYDTTTEIIEAIQEKE